MSHYCRWVKGKKCWQKSKRIKKAECTPCLIVQMWMTLGWTTNRPAAKKRVEEV